MYQNQKWKLSLENMDGNELSHINWAYKKRNPNNWGFFTIINDGVLEYELPYRVMHVSSKA